MTLISIVKEALSVLVVVGLAGMAFFFIGAAWKNRILGKWRLFVTRNALYFAFAAALIATSGSLFFSEIAHYDPCKLCWFQRIFMYPLAIMFAVAIWKKDMRVRRYALPLAVIGAPIAAYHYGLQVYNAISPITSSCSATGPSCASTPIMTFGFVTIPLMALVAFLIIIVSMALLGRGKGTKGAGRATATHPKKVSG